MKITFRTPSDLLRLTLAATAGFAIQATAADYQWDVNGATAGLGGGGTWNATNTFWDLLGTGLDDGTDTTVAYTFTGSDAATFGGTAGIVLVGGTYAGSINFTTGGYTFEMNGDNTDAIFSGMVTVADSGTTKFVNANNASGFWDYKFNGGLTIPTGGTAEVRAGANAGNANSYIASLSGGGDLTLYSNNNTLGHRIAGDNTGFTGNITIFTGLTRVETNTALGSGGSVTLTGGTLNINGKTIDKSVVLNGGALAGNGGTLSGVVSETGGPRSLAVATSLTLTNTNTYTGGTTVTGGTLTTGDDDALGSGAVALNGGTLDVGGSTLANTITLGGGAIIGNGGTLSGTISGTGALAVASDLTLTNANDYSGGTTLTAGTLNVGDNSALGIGAVTLSGGTLGSTGGTRTLGNAVTIDGNLTSLGAGGMTLSGAVTLAGTSQWQINNGVNAGQNLNITGNITGTGGLRRNAGNGSVTLSGDNDFSGGFTWAAGSVASLTIASNTALGTGTFTQAGGNANLSTGATDVTLTHNNTIELNANFSFNGPNNLDLGTGAVTINGDRTITVNSDTLTIGGAIGDGGSGYGLTKAGNGTLALAGSSTYTGTTLVSAGTLLLSGQLAGDVDVAPTATIGGNGTITGGLDFAAGANLLFDPSSTLLVDGGTVSFGGFSLANLFGLDSSVADGTYTLIDGTATFDFTNVGNLGFANAGDIGGGKSAYFQPGSLQLVVTSIPEPAAALLGGLGLLALLRRRRHA